MKAYPSPFSHILIFTKGRLWPKSLTRIGALLPLLFLVAACQKELPFDQEVITPKLVLNSLFSQDSVWQVHVSRSLSVIDGGDLTGVNDATVLIKNGLGNQVATLHHVADGVYAADSAMPAISESYTVEVSAPGYAPVTASDHIPGTVQILSLDTMTRRGPQGEDVLEFSLTFLDPAGQANFYSLQLYGEYAWIEPGYDTVTYRYPAGMYCNDPNLVATSAQDNYHQELLIQDGAIDGQTYTLKFEVPNIEFGQDEQFLGITISLISSSEAFFNYRKSYLSYQEGEGNPFAQPVQVYSNVAGGFGIFAGGSRTVWWLEN